MHWLFENEQQLTSLKEKSQNPGSSQAPVSLCPFLLVDWGQKNHWTNSKNFHGQQWVLGCSCGLVLFVYYAHPVVLGVQNVLCIFSQWRKKKTYTFRVIACTSHSWHERDHCSWLSIGVIKLEVKLSQCGSLRFREAYLTAVPNWLLSLNSMPWSQQQEKRKLLKVCSLTQWVRQESTKGMLGPCTKQTWSCLYPQSLMSFHGAALARTLSTLWCAVTPGSKC